MKSNYLSTLVQVGGGVRKCFAKFTNVILTELVACLSAYFFQLSRLNFCRLESKYSAKTLSGKSTISELLF